MDLQWPGSLKLLTSLLAVGVLLSSTVLGQPPAGTPGESGSEDNVKPPWEWTLEERLNARFDPQKIRQRMKNRGHNPQVDLDTVPENYEILSGQEHPHLFLPSRVFDAMLNSAFLADADFRTPRRKQMAERYHGDLEIDGAFWRDLSIVLASYLNTKLEYERLERDYLATEDEQERRRLKAEVQKENMVRCRARFQALEAAREYFGSSEFDRFLYEAVAAELWEAGLWTTSLRQARANIARGCPHAF